MVAVLDTNHFTELVRESSYGQRLRLHDRQVSAFTTVVNPGNHRRLVRSSTDSRLVNCK
ncbi:MAG: hypothetical protein ACOYOF_06775 [Verrucomicrobiaceae bacterium]